MSRASPNSTHGSQSNVIQTQALADIRSPRVIHSQITGISPAPTASINVSFTPPSTMAAQWDRFVVDKVVLRAFRATGSYPPLVAYDPVNTVTVTTNQHILNYANCMIVEPIYAVVNEAPVLFSYTVEKPTHQSLDSIGDLRTPITCTQSWNAGSLFLGSFYAGVTSGMFQYSLEWHITLIGPHADLA
jgi:hypothetical protein